MIVSHEARVLFVHVQKTGGMAVQGLLLESLPGAVQPDGDRHAPLGRILRDQPELRDYWTFGFVRNPWARMWSWWSMIQRRAEAAETNEWVASRVVGNSFWAHVLTYPDFETFVLQGPRDHGRLRRSQLGYLRSEDRVADLIGRTESLDEDVATVCRTLGLPAPSYVERRNAGDSGSYRDHYTPRMRRKIGRLFADDVAAFDYEF